MIIFAKPRASGLKVRYSNYPGRLQKVDIFFANAWCFLLRLFQMVMKFNGVKIRRYSFDNTVKNCEESV